MKLARQNQRVWSVVTAFVVTSLMLTLTFALLGSLHRASAAPSQDNNRGHWVDPFTDATGLDTATDTEVNTAQDRLELEPPRILSQTDWSAGPGLPTTTATSTNRYSMGTRLNSALAGDLSLGFSLPASDTMSTFAQDGYPDLVLSNYYSGVMDVDGDYADESYLYYGSSSGFTESNRSSLTVTSAQGNSIADLNDDGFLDIVFARGNEDDRSGPAVIYWGSQDGYSSANRSELPSYLSTCSTIADLDQDGYLDIVICNFMDGSYDVTIDSYIYWGNSSGVYTTTNRTGLPTVGAMSAYAADLDADGYLDLIFSNYRSTVFSSSASDFNIDSYIYWGSASGFTDTNRAEFPTVGAHGSSAGDLDQDGYLDLVVSNRRTGNTTPVTATYEISSYVYWGSSNGFTDTDRLELPTIGSYGNSLADLDGDGYLDIIFSNHDSGITHTLDSYIYWNDNGTFTTTDRSDLPTLGATGNCAGDLDLDGDVDIVFANRRLGDDHNVPSYIYWNDGGTYTTTRRDTLNTRGALGCSIAGGTIAAANTAYGNVYAEPITGSTTIADTATTPRIYAATGVLTSTGFDAGDAHVWQEVSWNVSLPSGTDVSLDVATSDDGTSWSAWTQVAASSSDGANSASLTVADARFIRYRATLSASGDHLRTPVLQDVQIVGGRTAGNATSVTITPTALDRWNTVTWTAQVAAGQAITVQVLESDGTLVPDSDLPGNSSGFSLSPIDVSSLDVSTYPSLKLRAGFSTDDVTSSPSLDDWSVDWFATPTSLSISPADDTITAGDDVTYTVLAQDDYGQSWNVTANSQYTITPAAGGSWTDNVYSSQLAGSWTVTATYGTLVTTTQLTVNPGPLHHIVISPSSASVDSGDVQAYTAEAFDVYGNSRGDVTASTAFVIEAGAGGTWSDESYTAEVAGTWVVTGTFSGQVDTATLTVANVAPTAVIDGPTSGDEGQTLSFNANSSSDPGNNISAYAWDLDNDGQYDDATGPTCSYAWDDDGTVTIGLVVTDTGNLTDTDTAVITVNNVAPTLTLSGDATVDEGATYTLTLSAVTDPGDDTVSACTVTWGDGDDDDCFGAIGGTITHVYADGDASPTISVDLTDEDGTYEDVDSQGVTVSNVAPVVTLSGDAAVDEGATYTLTLSAVTDPGDDAITACTVTWGDGADESCLGAIDGTITHVYPNGDDSHTISVDLTDEDGTYTDVDTHAVTVNNVAPVAVDDEYDTPEDTTLTVPAAGVLTNDTDVPADALTAVLDEDVGTGTLALSSDGSFVYTPTLNYNGAVTFTYHANDGAADSNTAVVTITVTAENDPPVADAGGPYTTDEGGDINLDGSGSSDVDGSIPTYEWDCTDDGTYDVTAPGPTGETCTYDDDGTYTVRLRVTDDHGAMDTDTATVTVSNVAPVLTLSGDASVDEGATYTLTLSAVTDPGNDTIDTCTVTWGDGDDDDCLGAIDGTITHVYPNGDDSHTISVDLADEDGTYTDVDTHAVTVNNVAPVAVDDEYDTPEDTTLTVPAAGVLTNDSDVPADALTAVLDDDVGTGTLALSSDGSFVYTPTLNYNGAVTFTYHANDGAADSNTAVVTITVTAENDPPVADAGGPYTTDEGGDINLDGSGSSDVDGSITTYEWDCTDDGTYDVTAPGPTGETCTYGDDGTYTVRLRVTDDHGAMDTDTATVTVNNVAPVAADDEYSTPEDTTLTVPAAGVLTNDTDVPADALTAVLDEDVGTGTLALSSDGSFVYTPTLDYNGLVTFTYHANDGAADSNTAVVTITVTVENDLPTADADGPYTTDEGGEIDLDGSGSSDIDGTITTYEWDCTDDGTYDVTSSSSTGDVCTYDDDGTYTVRLRVTDDLAGTDTATATVTVSNVAPVMTLSGDAAVDEGATYTLTLSAVTDPGDDTVSACTVTWGDGGDDDCLSAIDGTITHTYADGDDSPTISVDLADEDGAYEDVDTQAISVTNVAPVVTLSGDAAVDEGATYTLTLSTATDPGDDTVSACTVTWGDGDDDDCLAALGGTLTHTYADGDDSHTISVDLTDEDGTYEDVDTLDLDVNNLPPTADAGGPYSGVAGVPIDFSAADSSDPVSDPLTYEWDWDNDGTYDDLTTSAVISHTWTIAQVYTVSLRVTDGDGGADTDTATVTVDPGAVHHIALNPVDASINPDETITYTVEALDVFDNLVSDVTSSSTFTIEVGAGGFWDGNVYHPEVKGNWVVTATYQTMQTNATLHVRSYMIYLPMVARGG